MALALAVPLVALLLVTGLAQVQASDMAGFSANYGLHVSDVGGSYCDLTAFAETSGPIDAWYVLAEFSGAVWRNGIEQADLSGYVSVEIPYNWAYVENNVYDIPSGMGYSAQIDTYHESDWPEGFDYASAALLRRFVRTVVGAETAESV